MSKIVSSIRDGLANIMTGLGGSSDKRMYNMWQLEMLDGYQQLDAAYQSNWIARAIVDMPAQDMTREWRTIKCEDAEAIGEVEQQLNLQGDVQDAVAWSRLYGGAVILMLTNQPLDKPLDVNRIGKGDLKRLIVLDRWDTHATQINMTDVLAENYLRPQVLTIQGGSQQIHHSHFAFFRGDRLPRRYMQQTHGWGDSALRKCIGDVTDMVAAKDGIANLMQKAHVDTITVEGLANDISSDQDSKIVERYRMFNLMMSNIHLALLDEGEKLERQTMSLSGVAPVIENFMTWISGASRIPVTKLFGTSAKGMNATGEGDMRNYYDDIAAMRVHHVNRPLRYIDEVLVRSALGYWPDDYDYVWNPLEQVNSLQAAQAELLTAQRDTTYLDAGVVRVDQVQRTLQSAETYPITDEDINEVNPMDDPALPVFGEELPNLTP